MQKTLTFPKNDAENPGEISKIHVNEIAINLSLSLLSSLSRATDVIAENGRTNRKYLGKQKMRRHNRNVTIKEYTKGMAQSINNLLFKVNIM